MNKVQEALNEVCKDYCKYTAEVDGRNVLDVGDPNAMCDEEFDDFCDKHCWYCPINDLFDE